METNLDLQICGVDDSGVESNESDQKALNIDYKPVSIAKPSTYKALQQTSELQKKIERQRDVARRTSSVSSDPGSKKHTFVSRARLTVPSQNSRVTQRDIDGSSDDQELLVAIMTDGESEDEFDVPRFPKAAQKEITEQLIKDGYNLDLEPDDEDLDLIPPRPLNERCCCWVTCGIQ